MIYVFLPVLFSLGLSRFLAEHVTGQLRLLILVVPCVMESLWLPIVLNMLEDILCHFPIVTYLDKDVLIGQVIKGLQ